jgi:hypothetical protein
MANRWPPWIETTVVKPALQDVAPGAAVKITVLELVVTPKLPTRICGMWTLDVENLGAGAGQAIFDQYVGGVLHRIGPAPAAWPAGERREVTVIGTFDVAAAATSTLELYLTTVAQTFRVHAVRSMVTFFGMPSEGESY